MFLVFQGEKVETNMGSILSRIKDTNCAIFYLRHIFLICVIFLYLGHFLFNEFLFEICHVVQKCEADYLTHKDGPRAKRIKTFLMVVDW